MKYLFSALMLMMLCWVSSNSYADAKAFDAEQACWNRCNLCYQDCAFNKHGEAVGDCMKQCADSHNECCENHGARGSNEACGCE